MSWDPNTYNQFQQEREMPFADLFGLLHVRAGMQVIDLGCGTGRLTRQLADRLPHSEVLGIDSSPQMLAAARELERPGLRFELRMIESIQGQWDLVFSHAVLQWLEDHVSLIHRLFRMVRPGGQLAVQIPDNHAAVPHQLILETAHEKSFRDALGGWTRVSPNLPMEQYARLLHEHCGEDFTVLARIYPVVLEDADGLLDWTSGTALLPYLERLPEPLRESFRESYRQRLRQAYPSSPVFYPFRRILFAGTRQV